MNRRIILMDEDEWAVVHEFGENYIDHLSLDEIENGGGHTHPRFLHTAVESCDGVLAPPDTVKTCRCGSKIPDHMLALFRLMSL